METYRRSSVGSGLGPAALVWLNNCTGDIFLRFWIFFFGFWIFIVYSDTWIFSYNIFLSF